MFLLWCTEVQPVSSSCLQVNKEHLLDVGAMVEVRCHDRQFTGGWFRARILQVCCCPAHAHPQNPYRLQLIRHMEHMVQSICCLCAGVGLNADDEQLNFWNDVTQVAQGSVWEGGLRFEVELEDVPAAGDAAPSKGQTVQAQQGATLEGEDAEGERLIDEEGAAGKERGWVPMVHAPANTEWPAVLIREPLQPAAPPTPPVEWRVGERVEVCPSVPAQLCLCCIHAQQPTPASWTR